MFVYIVYNFNKMIFYYGNVECVKNSNNERLFFNRKGFIFNLDF